MSRLAAVLCTAALAVSGCGAGGILDETGTRIRYEVSGIGVSRADIEYQGADRRHRSRNARLPWSRVVYLDDPGTATLVASSLTTDSATLTCRIYAGTGTAELWAEASSGSQARPTVSCLPGE